MTSRLSYFGATNSKKEKETKQKDRKFLRKTELEPQAKPRVTRLKSKTKKGGRSKSKTKKKAVVRKNKKADLDENDSDEEPSSKATKKKPSRKRTNKKKTTKKTKSSKSTKSKKGSKVLNKVKKTRGSPTLIIDSNGKEHKYSGHSDPTRRISPAGSATESPVGTIEKGLNGDLWIVTLKRNGVQFWKRYKKE